VIEKARRKELVREYREQKQLLGIYAVRCEPAGKIWIAATKNLDRQKNGIWFQLRLNGHPNRAMMSAWKTYGEASFRYEILEEVDDENPLLLDFLLKDRAQHWLKQLKAEPVVG
jgi:hypothetical protein